MHLSSNLLLNVGPMADGTLDPVFEERLLEIGAWLDVSHLHNVHVLLVYMFSTCTALVLHVRIHVQAHVCYQTF